jgi:Rieske 2Fe-2S family protein
MGDDEGRAHGVFNVCRHRGARLVSEPEGTMRRLQCPYHAWCYGFDGSLKSAPHTEEIQNFGSPGLHRVRMEERHGLLFADVSGTDGALDDHLGDLTPHLEHYRLGELERAGAITYEVEANWKAIVENYSECLHCPGVHPELNRLSHYESGEEYEGAGAWCGGSMTLNEGAETMAQNGGHGLRPAIRGLTDKEQRDVLYFALFPNLLVSLHPDYVMVHTLWPRGAGRTEVVCEWYFEPETIAQPGFDPADAVDFWDTVNRQDWHVCELVQRGIGSRGHVPGRYTDTELTVHAFDQLVAEAYLTR